MAAVDWAEDDEWELVNDDGFVYKRKKRRVHPITSISSSALPLPDPAAEEKNSRERKKRTLMKLKESYQKEIDQWEYLSNTLKEMQEKAKNQQQELEQRQERAALSGQTIGSPIPSARPSDSFCLLLADNLLVQAEAHEAIIRDVSNLCDVAEALCNAQEERWRKSLIDLPIWGSSARDLMSSLCEE